MELIGGLRLREREERRRTKSGFTVLQQWRSVIYIGKLIDFGNCLFVCVCVCVWWGWRMRWWWAWPEMDSANIIFIYYIYIFNHGFCLFPYNHHILFMYYIIFHYCFSFFLGRLPSIYKINKSAKNNSTTNFFFSFRFWASFH